MEGPEINSDKQRRQNNIDTDYNSYIRKNIATVKPIKLNRSQKNIIRDIETVGTKLNLA